MKPTACESAYIAGFIDGEGCFCIARVPPYGTHKTVSYRGSLVIANTNEDVLRFIRSKIGGRITPRPPATPRYKASFLLRLSMQQTLRAVGPVGRHLRIKRPQVAMLRQLDALRQQVTRIALRAIGGRFCGIARSTEDYLARQDEIYKKMRVLNQRGAQ